MTGKNTPHQALYLKYRSKSLDEVIGQEHITRILTEALKKDRVAHAYLFTGPRGVGKTSVARILAHQIADLPYSENSSHPDIIEIDAASNRRIDDIRDLRDKVQIAPIASKRKVYIIDEVHMLTGESFNAFLKTLEEPPAHVVFILATTDAHKLPVTVTSRTQRFTFRTIPTEQAVKHLRSIAKTEKIAITNDALELIAEHGDGSFRDSISLLDQLSSLVDKDSEITTEMIEDVLGLADQDRVKSLLEAYQAKQSSKIIDELNKLSDEGVHPATTASQLIRLAANGIKERPELVSLLNSLIDVQASPRPDVKLITALIDNQPSANKKPNVVLAEATVQSPPHELESLTRQATKPQPTEPVPAIKSLAEPVAEAANEPTVVEPVAQKPTASAVVTDFNWQALLTSAKAEHVALHSIINRCQIELNGSKLTIFTGSSFWKNKLDTSRYQMQLQELLAKHGGSELELEMIPQVRPPQDKTAASVAELMGGGVEVSLEEIG